MVTIYVLKLKNNKYYIGKTKNLIVRLQDHFAENGSEWTKLHEPLEIESVYNDCDDFDEDKITKQYMQIFGIKNVRGGSYCQTNLNKPTVKLLEEELKTASDNCYSCGQAGHQKTNCPMKVSKKKPVVKQQFKPQYKRQYFRRRYARTYENNDDDDEEEECEEDSDDDDDNYQGGKCYKCNRYGHYAANCYARTKVYYN
jgi:hypothetical protein